MQFKGIWVVQESLFRREVLEARREGWLGGIAVATPMSRWLLVVLAAVLGTSIVLFLVFGHYTRRESVVGQLVPSAGLLNVAAPIAGTVSRVLVGDGQPVEAGDVLMELSGVQDASMLGDTHDLIDRQLQSQRDRLRADFGNQRQLAEQQADGLHGKIALLRAQLAQVRGQMQLQQQQADGAQKLLERVLPSSAKGHADALQARI